jgi:uncharacterized protein HemX
MKWQWRHPILANALLLLVCGILALAVGLGISFGGPYVSRHQKSKFAQQAEQEHQRRDQIIDKALQESFEGFMKAQQRIGQCAILSCGYEKLKKLQEEADIAGAIFDKTSEFAKQERAEELRNPPPD